MSIVAQAQRSASVLCRFLDDRLRHRGDVEDGWVEMLQAASGPECGLRHRWDDLGRALELRIGLDLGQCPEPQGLLTYLPPEQYAELLVSVGMKPRYVRGMPAGGTSDPVLLDWRRAPEPQPVDQERERRALATSLDLMEVNKMAHNHRDWAVDRRRFWFVAATEGGSLGADLEAVDALGKAWAQYVEQGRAAFHALGDRVVVAPELGNGFGIADLIVGKALVDVKLTRESTPPVGEWLRQLLGYLLLDWDDVLRLETLAVYAGWQGRMLTSRP
ncbi:hypothetical protein [Saccharopolyspora hattusasensis]|uniref:hypothetical protein n=1 Tax=Saccharopolyspora hattusasensis TaxID=1128679 RepID=UPI003D99D633